MKANKENVSMGYNITHMMHQSDIVNIDALVDGKIQSQAFMLFVVETPIRRIRVRVNERLGKWIKDNE